MLRAYRLTVLILILLATGSHAQLTGSAATTPTRGRVEGQVRDQRGQPLSGALVNLLQARGASAQVAVSDAAGKFSFVNLTPGPYSLRVTLVGFKPYSSSFAVASGLKRLTVQLTAETATDAVKAEADVRSDTVRVEAPAARAQEAEHKVAIGRTRVGGNVGYAPPPPSAYPVGGRPQHGSFNTAEYAHIDSNDFLMVRDHPLSTFSADVDTASYANVRRFITQGDLPPADAVRIEEMINYFTYTYPQPKGDAPFSVTTDVIASPWNPRHQLALIGLQARRVEQADVPARNLVFLLDVSGSMMPSNRLPLVKNAMRLLVDDLRPQDRVAIVVYAGASGLALPSTPGSEKARIREELASLAAGGSTNGAEGIVLAYQQAQDHFIKGGINRVILATDGDFNVGVTSEGELVRLIEEKRKTGIFLSVLGVGESNLKDSRMEQLADRGNGNYSYLDSIHEAHKVLVSEAGATLVTVAKDVKLQVEFNPATVGAYRLIGYENRLLAAQDFNDDKKDAGEIGAGHSVTALYEIVPKGLETPGGATVDPLKYQSTPALSSAASKTELMTVKLRYKEPDGDTSRLIAATAVRSGESRVTTNTGFAAAVAGFGMLLRDSEHKGQTTYDLVLKLAREHRGDDAAGYRAEFIRIVEMAQRLATSRVKPEEKTTSRR